MVTKDKADEIDHRAAIAAEAAAWFAKLQGPGRTPATLAAFREWLATSQDHAEAFNTATDIWELLPGALNVSATAPQPRKRAATFLKMGAFATAAAASLAFLFFLFFPFSETAIYSTAVGEQRSVVLSDGSYIALNTNTTLVVRFYDRKREIALQKGEASFEVAKDKSRPFIVSVAGERVSALGTKFNVRVEARNSVVEPQTQVIVTLLEGRVEVGKQPPILNVTAAKRSSRVLEPGERLTVRLPTNSASGSMTVDRPNVANLVAWQRGEIVFDDAPMPEVVAELNRYGETQILLRDRGLEKLRVSGVFRSRETKDAVEMIAHMYGLRVVSGFNNSIFLEQ